jgi:hypothetical protein
MNFSNWREHVGPVLMILFMSIVIFFVFHWLDPILNFEQFIITDAPIVLPEYKII